VITLSATHSPSGLPATSLVAVGVAILVTWIVLLLTARLPGNRGGNSLIHDVVTYIPHISVEISCKFAGLTRIFT
jgi:hypothetical protein